MNKTLLIIFLLITTLANSSDWIAYRTAEDIPDPESTNRYAEKTMWFRLNSNTNIHRIETTTFDYRGKFLTNEVYQWTNTPIDWSKVTNSVRLYRMEENQFTLTFPQGDNGEMIDPKKARIETCLRPVIRPFRPDFGDTNIWYRITFEAP